MFDLDSIPPSKIILTEEFHEISIAEIESDSWTVIYDNSPYSSLCGSKDVLGGYDKFGKKTKIKKNF